jgi:hypothetical protein
MMSAFAYTLSLPEDPKSGILLPRGAVPGFGVLFRALCITVIVSRLVIV